MAESSYINVSERPTNDRIYGIPTDESIGAILFDISGFNQPFERFGHLYNVFGEEKLIKVSSLEEVRQLGIEDNGFLNGMPYYHISQFYKYLDNNQELYLCIADCSTDWSILQKMQMEAKGRLFHIGIWTSQPIWDRNSEGDLVFSPLLSRLQAQADEIDGKVGTSVSSATPLSLILSGNSYMAGGSVVDYKKIPNAMFLGYSKVSVALIQNGIDKVHTMQSQNPQNAPVGSIGVIMALLSKCGVEESIASVLSCDLNKDDEFEKPEWGFGRDNGRIGTINQIWANITINKGYIIPMTYAGLEASCFLSSDSTLSSGDFGAISSNRVIHKCRRAVRTALLPYVNGTYHGNPSSPSALTVLFDSINTQLAGAMRSRFGKDQIEEKSIEFVSANEDDDSINISISVRPVSSSRYISETVSYDPL